MAQKKGRGRVAVINPSANPNTTQLSEKWIPSWEVPDALKRVVWAMKDSEKLIDEWVKSQGPLWIQILDSRANEDRYIVKFRVTNATIHGVYIDTLKLTSPFQQNLEITATPPTIKLGHDHGEQPSANVGLQSKLFSPGMIQTCTLEFPLPKQENLRTWRLGREKCLGSVKVTYWVLNEKSHREKDVDFSIRLLQEV